MFKIKFVTLFIAAFFYVPAFAAQNAVNNVDSTYDKEEERLVTAFGVVYKGMPIHGLAEAGFTDEVLISHDRKDNEEYITFRDITSSFDNATITFYVCNGEVRDWFRGENLRM